MAELYENRYYRMMTPEELADEMLDLDIGERIDIPTRDINMETEYGKGGSEWYGIARIDADVFCEQYAWLCDYYGGECAGIITVSDADMSCPKIAKVYIVNQLNEWLRKWGIICSNGKVAVEVSIAVKKFKKGED